MNDSRICTETKTDESFALITETEPISELYREVTETKTDGLMEAWETDATLRRPTRHDGTLGIWAEVGDSLNGDVFDELWERKASTEQTLCELIKSVAEVKLTRSREDLRKSIRIGNRESVRIRSLGTRDEGHQKSREETRISSSHFIDNNSN
ncbi:hypothetical protein PoB_001924000 [Plakobranchus ocellatus]|uniref:Uncharacterized protein n=1 Tax=Plakobranchus ocellatus TaxID=259542 RepID=A0AAV3ZB28_9GAST|nr:hypothetical protein PoB_001924000 [Plakobranchus ocellatus]